MKLQSHLLSLALLALAAGPLAAQAPDALNEANEQALKAAAAKVAPSVVQIETTGGAELIGAADGRVGQWALALGRTLTPNLDLPPSVSVGVVSALGRVTGKAIQTDAKVSPV